MNLSIYINFIKNKETDNLKKQLKSDIIENKISEKEIHENFQNLKEREMVLDLYTKIKFELRFNKNTIEHDNWVTSQSFDNKKTEEELKKIYLNKYELKIIKAAELLKKVLLENVPGSGISKLYFIGSSYAKKIYDVEDKEKFAKYIREKITGLKKNKALCKKIIEGLVTPDAFCSMTVNDLKSEEVKIKEKKIIEDSINASKQPKVEAETDMFKCRKCNQNKTTYRQQQTRSCDEPMTTIVVCSICGFTWRF